MTVIKFYLFPTSHNRPTPRCPTKWMRIVTVDRVTSLHLCIYAHLLIELQP